VEITTASTALKALEKIAAFPHYDLCLIDLGLPDMNGVELIKKIKGSSPISRFIIMTGKYYSERDLFEDMRESAEIGYCRLITKPFDFAESLEVIFQVLEEKQIGSANIVPNCPVKESQCW
jgi:two-component system KDP operon response regulator KdpE